MSDAPREEPDPAPARIVEEPLDYPVFNEPLDDDDHEEWPPRRSGWPHPDEFWP